MGIEVKTVDEQTALWRLNKLLAVLGKIETTIEEACRKEKVTLCEDYNLLVTHSLCKSLRVFREIICLVQNGYCDGALALSRNIYEQSVILRWFHTKQKTVDKEEFNSYVANYFIAGKIQMYKTLKWECEVHHDDKGVAEYQQEIDHCKESIAQIKSSTTPVKAKGDYWWAGQSSFADLVLAINSDESEEWCPFFWSLHSSYKLSCSELHAGALGNNFVLSQDKDFFGIDQSLHPERCGVPMWYSTVSLIEVVGVTFTTLGMSEGGIIRTLNELTKYYMDIEQKELSSRPSVAQQSLNQD